MTFYLQNEYNDYVIVNLVYQAVLCRYSPRVNINAQSDKSFRVACTCTRMENQFIQNLTTFFIQTRI